MCLSLLSFDGQASLCKRWILISLFSVTALFGISLQAQAQAPCDPTSFACQVELAIDVALHNLRGREGGNGYFDNRGSNQNFKHNFLGLLSFLEKREGVGWQGPSLGYDGLPPLDQQLALRLVRNIIEGEPAMTDATSTPFTYTVGGNMMALSAYLSTGGPEEVNATTTVSQALANAVLAMNSVQGDRAPNNEGGWNYRRPEINGDLSTTQFAVAGLSAARVTVRRERESVLVPRALRSAYSRVSRLSSTTETQVEQTPLRVLERGASVAYASVIND